MKVVKAEFGKRAPVDLSSQLRELADAVDNGEIVDLCAVFVRNDSYDILTAASLEQRLILPTLLHRSTVDKFFQG